MKNLSESQKETLDYWKSLADGKSILASDMAAYMIIKAIWARNEDKLAVAKGLLFKAFSPVVNQRKLQKNSDAFQGLKSAVNNAMYSMLPQYLSPEDLSEFKKLHQQLTKETLIDESYVYVIVRRDLEKVQQLVQAAHVTMVVGQAVSKHKHNAARQNFCVFGTEDLQSLEDMKTRLLDKKISFKEFYEPDLKNQLTAIATLPLRKNTAVRKKVFETSTLLVM